MFRRSLFHNLCLLLVATVLVGANGMSQAQQIHLRQQAVIDGEIIRLGEVAQFVGGSLAEQSQLNKLELFPFDRRRTTLLASEIREELTVLGVDLIRWQMQGASKVQLVAGAAEGMQTNAKAFSRNAPLSQTASLNHLRLRSHAPISPSQQRTSVATALISYESPDGQAVASPVEAPVPSVSRKEAETRVAWTVREDLPRGTIISDSDLVSVEVPGSRGGLIGDRQDIVGKQVRQPLRAGQPISENGVETVKYVKRGKEVRVITHVDLIQVSTIARSTADATLGQDVLVESLDRKKQFLGTVTGHNEVTIRRAESSGALSVARVDQKNVLSTSGAGLARDSHGGNSRSASAIRSDRLPGNSLR